MMGRIKRWGEKWEARFFEVRSRAVRACIAPRKVVRSRGTSFTLSCENWITHYRLKAFSTKEPETLDWIDTWVRDGDTFFDIGANVGVYSIYAALRNPRSCTVAFEVEYSNLHLLKENIIQNNLKDRIKVFSVALSNTPGISYLNIQDATPGSALHSVGRDHADMTLTGHRVIWREGVATYTIDAFCRETGLMPNCIKLDVDGTERKILDGAREALRSPGFRSLIVEFPEETGERGAIETLLKEAGLTRVWRDSSLKSPNEIWVRREHL